MLPAISTSALYTNTSELYLWYYSLTEDIDIDGGIDGDIDEGIDGDIDADIDEGIDADIDGGMDYDVVVDVVDVVV